MYILTAHHVIANHVQISVYFDQLSVSGQIRAVLVGGNPELDVALLKIPKLKSISFENALRIDTSEGAEGEITSTSKVAVLGFAHAMHHIQTTMGVISGRVCNPARYQIDAAVNPGNSGGPVVNMHGNVVGIVTSGVRGAQNINFAAPIYETEQCILRILENEDKEPKVLNVGSVVAVIDNCVVEKKTRRYLPLIEECNAANISLTLDNSNFTSDKDTVTLSVTCNGKPRELKCLNTVITPFLDRICKLNLKLVIANPYLIAKLKCESGTYVAGVNTRVHGCNILPGDIIASIDNKAIDAQQCIMVNFWRTQEEQPGKIHFTSIVERKNPGDVVELEVQTNEIKKKLSISLKPNLSSYRRMYADMERIPFCSQGGVFVMTLYENHVESHNKTCLRHLMNTPLTLEHNVVIITSILPESPFIQLNTLGVGDIVVSVNDVAVHTLEQYQNAWVRAMCMCDVINDKLVIVNVQELQSAGSETPENKVVKLIKATNLTTSSDYMLTGSVVPTDLFDIEGDIELCKDPQTVLIIDESRYINLRQGLVTIKVRDGNINSANTLTIVDVHARIKETYGNTYVQ